MRILNVISLLLAYPDEAIVDGRDELAQAIRDAREISRDRRAALLALLDELTGQDLMDAQERYSELFDKGRHLSLLLFEHVHGESRDRGQAMVDLMAQYEAAGFAIALKELPDYIPLYLEFLSTQDSAVAREGIADISHLLALLAARLEERHSRYAAAFQALLQMAGESVGEAVGRVRPAVAAERRDDSLEAMDRLWEEEQGTFLQGEPQGGCGADAQRPRKAREETPVPLHWVDFDHAPAAAPARR